MAEHPHICINPNGCTTPAHNGSRCATCASYLWTFGRERPAELIRYPGRRHPLPSGKELEAMLDVSYRRIDYLIRSGRFMPTVYASGSGTKRGFTFDDAVVVAALLAVPSDVDVASLSDAVRAGDPAWVSEYAPAVTVSVNLDELRMVLVERWPQERATDLPVVASV